MIRKYILTCKNKNNGYYIHQKIAYCNTFSRETIRSCFRRNHRLRLRVVVIVTNRLQTSTNVFIYDYLSSFWTESISQIKGILGWIFFHKYMRKKKSCLPKMLPPDFYSLTLTAGGSRSMTKMERSLV